MTNDLLSFAIPTKTLIAVWVSQNHPLGYRGNSPACLYGEGFFNFALANQGGVPWRRRLEDSLSRQLSAFSKRGGSVAVGSMVSRISCSGGGEFGKADDYISIWHNGRMGLMINDLTK